MRARARGSRQRSDPIMVWNRYTLSHMRRRVPCGVLAGGLFALALSTLAAAQFAGVHPVSGRRFAPVMGWQGADWLERGERIEEEAPDVAVRALKIAKGATVADIGAGSGYMTMLLSEAVGPTGTVYANDVQPQMLQMLQQRLAQKQIKNV